MKTSLGVNITQVVARLYCLGNKTKIVCTYSVYMKLKFFFLSSICSCLALPPSRLFDFLCFLGEADPAKPNLFSLELTVKPWLPSTPPPPPASQAGVTDMSHHANFFVCLLSSLSIYHLYSVDFEYMKHVGMESRLSLLCTTRCI